MSTEVCREDGINVREAKPCLCVTCRSWLKNMTFREMLYCRVKGCFVFPMYGCGDYEKKKEVENAGDRNS